MSNCDQYFIHHETHPSQIWGSLLIIALIRGHQLMDRLMIIDGKFVKYVILVLNSARR